MTMPVRGGVSLLELVLSLALLAILSVTIHQHMTVTLNAAAQAQARFSCLVGANNLLEMGMGLKTSTPLLTGLKAILNDDGTPNTYFPLPQSLQPLGTVGVVKGRVATVTVDISIETGSSLKTTTHAIQISVRDEMTNNEVRIQGYRDPLE